MYPKCETNTVGACSHTHVTTSVLNMTMEIKVRLGIPHVLNSPIADALNNQSRMLLPCFGIGSLNY